MDRMVKEGLDEVLVDAFELLAVDEIHVGSVSTARERA
jgi:hypothetical protein